MDGSIHDLENGLKAKLIIEDKVNIKQFGAKGDGVNIENESKAIQAAFDYCNNVIFAEGVYLIQTPLLIKHKLNLIGSGKVILKLSVDSTNIFTLQNTINEFDFNIKNIEFDMNELVGKGISLTNNNLFSVNIKKCKFYNNKPDINGDYAIYCNNIKALNVEDCKFYNIYTNAISCLNTESFQVQNNYFYDIGNQNSHREGSAFYVKGSTYITAFNNLIKDTTDSAIYFDQSYNEFAQIIGNKIYNCGKEAIKNQTTSKKTIITNNIIDGSTCNGIACNGYGTEVIISNNIVHNIFKSGDPRGTNFAAIVIGGGQNIIISGNEIKYVAGNNLAGIDVRTTNKLTEKGHNVIISDNIIDCISGMGIRLSSTDNVTVRGNIIKNTNLNTTSWKTAFYAQEVKNLNINGNNITKSEYIYGHCYKLTDNTIQMPICLSDKDIFSGKSITLICRDDVADTKDKVFTTTVSSYDINTHIITLMDNIDIDNIYSNEFLFKLENSILIEWSLRLYQNVINVTILGNVFFGSTGSIKNDNPNTNSYLPTGDIYRSTNQIYNI